MGGAGQVVLTGDAPASEGSSVITDYEYRINGRNPWTSIGSTNTTHTVTGLVNGTTYVFQVRVVNAVGGGRASNWAEATPEVFTLNFAHCANGTSILSEMVFVNLETQPSGTAPTPFHRDIPPTRPVIYFYDQGGHPIAPGSMVDVTGDLEVTEDGALTVRTGPIGGFLRYTVPWVGVAGVGASPPVRDVLFPADCCKIIGPTARCWKSPH